MQKLITGILIAFCGIAYAANPDNTDYNRVTEIKVWKTYIDIYSTVDHTCDNADKKRYVLDKEEKEMYAIALTAMVAGMKASIKYNCGTDGKPQIDGIRVKP